MARAVMRPLTPTERMRSKARDGRSMRAKPDEVHQAERPADFLRAAGNLQPAILVPRARRLSSRIFPACAPCWASGGSTAVHGVPGGMPFGSSPCAIWARGWRHGCVRIPSGRRPLAPALEIAQLEWADIEAFDGPAEPALLPEELNSLGVSRVRLKLQPRIRLLSLHYPVDDLLLEVRNETRTRMSPATLFRSAARKKVHAVAKLKPDDIFLAVHRFDDSVYFRRIEPEEFAILGALRKGKPLGQAIEAALRKTSIPPEERPESLQRWFQNWAALGWFCQPEKEVRFPKTSWRR